MGVATRVRVTLKAFPIRLEGCFCMQSVHNSMRTYNYLTKAYPNKDTNQWHKDRECLSYDLQLESPTDFASSK